MKNEKRLIDANILEEVIRHDFYRVNITIADKVMEAIQSAPTVEATEVVHGRWEKHGKHDWNCSVCGIGVPYSYTGNRYCHNCGAKMDGGGYKMSNELKACPFCGGDAVFVHMHGSVDDMWGFVKCAKKTKHCCEQPRIRPKNLAIADWNKRIIV